MDAMIDRERERLIDVDYWSSDSMLDNNWAVNFFALIWKEEKCAMMISTTDSTPAKGCHESRG